MTTRREILTAAALGSLDQSQAFEIKGVDTPKAYVYTESTLKSVPPTSEALRLGEAAVRSLTRLQSEREISRG
jgi:hypothetical protein